MYVHTHTHTKQTRWLSSAPRHSYAVYRGLQRFSDSTSVFTCQDNATNAQFHYNLNSALIRRTSGRILGTFQHSSSLSDIREHPDRRVKVKDVCPTTRQAGTDARQRYRSTHILPRR